MSKEKLRNTAYTDKTSKNYIMDAAVIYTDIGFDGTDFTGNLLGATSGGTKLTITQEYEDIEVDGTSHMKVKGNKKLVSATAVIAANVKEITAKTLRMGLNANLVEADAGTAPAGYKQIDTKRFIDDEDYIENVALVGRISGSDLPMIAILDNAFVTTGVEIDTADNDEAVIELEFEAHATADQLHADEFPWRILYPEVA